MDLKKVFDQTVRELKREVNKKVLKVPEIEQKVLEATSNEPWGPHGTLMGDIAQATRNFNEYQMIMGILWKRLNDSGKNWRHVYKALTVLEFLVANGAERIIDDFSEHAYQVQTLVDFQYVEPSGRDQGINVRKKAQTLVSLLNDKEKIREVRQKAASNRDKYRGVSSTGIYKASSYSSTSGGYGGDREDERGGSNSRYSGRDEDRYGPGRERDGSRYRDDDRYGDRSREDGYTSDRDRYEEHEKYGTGDKRDESDKDRSFEDNDHASHRGAAGGKQDDYSQDDRRAEMHSSKARVNAPPSYEDTYLGQDSGYGQPEDSRDGGGLAAAVARAGTSRGQNQSFAASSQSAAGGSFFAKEESFDDFDPRGSSSRHALGASRTDPNIPVQTQSIAPSFESAGASKSVSGVEDLFSDAPFQAAFVAAPAPASQVPAITGPPAAGATSNQQYTGGDPFGSTGGSSLSAAPGIFAGESKDFFGSAPGEESIAFGGPTTVLPTVNAPVSVGGAEFFGGPGFNAFETSNGGSRTESSVAIPVSTAGTSSFGGPGFSALEPHSGGIRTESSVPTTLPPSVPSVALPSQVEKKKPFEQKGLWADTVGLVNLNIEGPKNNPLAELGIDLKSSFALSDRKREEKSQPTSMGKAMGSGTGLGRAGASILPPIAPSMVGMGPGMGMGMGMGMGIGMGPGMGPGFPPGMGPGFQPRMSMGMGAGGMAPGYGLGVGMNMGQGYGMGMPPVIGGGLPMGQGIGPGFVGSNPAGGLGPAAYQYGQAMGMSPQMGMGYGTGGYPNQQYGGIR